MRPIILGCAGCRLTGGQVAGALDLRQSEVQNLSVLAIGYEDVGRLDIPMNDSLGVSRFERVRDLNRQRQQRIEIESLPVTMCFKVTPSRYSMAMKSWPSFLPIS